MWIHLSRLKAIRFAIDWNGLLGIQPNGNRTRQVEIDVNRMACLMDFYPSSSRESKEMRRHGPMRIPRSYNMPVWHEGYDPRTALAC